ncbi:PREDICTED: dapper homolog 1-like [Cyprinodon variegatus]|uniref:Dapper homolog 1-like n=1 Tax=Cyprinodon variegatus TaxID=28743 RepID=A0A3Q2CS26_CYPVA|nr:PREDICTED: dapper homolog 1-like [Cyprinodon variegatus]
MLRLSGSLLQREPRPEEMPLFAASRRDAGCRHRAPPVRERLQLIVSVLGELEYLRHRQELLVLSALREERSAAPCEENLLVLRRQLSCLRRDAGVIGDLHELDQQISDLRLDAEVSHDPQETDSRPSSGFYELSDGASNSLSNSSHSVFSECFCSPAEAEGHFLSTDERSSSLEYDVLVGGLCDDSVCRSLSAPLQAPLDALVPTDSPAKTFCSLFSRNVADVYGHRSPLRSAALQASGSLQVSGSRGESRDEAGAECIQTDISPGPSPASGLQSGASQTPSSKHLERYIFGLLQRRAQPIRSSRSRTGISTDPLKGIARQHSLCLRQASGPSPGAGTLKASEVKPLPTPGETSAEGVSTSSSQRQCCVESRDEKGSLRVSPDDADMVPVSSNSTSPAGSKCCVTNRLRNSSNKKVLSKACRELPGPSVQTPLQNSRAQKSLKLNSFHRDSCCPLEQEEILQPPLTSKPQTGSSRKSSELQRGPSENGLELQLSVSEASVVRRGHASNGIAAKQHHGKHRHGNSRKVSKVKSASRSNTTSASELKKLPSEKRGDGFQRNSDHGRSHPAEDGRSKQLKVSTSSGDRVPDKHVSSALAAARSGAVRLHRYGADHHHHKHRREQLVVSAKPKMKGRVFQFPRTMVEIPYDGGTKHSARRQRKTLQRKPAATTCSTSREQQSGPYANAAKSDSEYSAECVSLFHSTIVDTSEDDGSSYTTNCFGDSESSEEEEEENATTDTEESVGGGPRGGGAEGHLRTARVTAGKLQMDPAQTKAPVKIKVSYNLKRKILRFRSGSLKLMTTV